MTTIMLADDHALVREGVRAVLTAGNSWTVVGEASNGLEAVKLAEQLQPKLLIVDLMLPGLSGMEVLRQVRKRAPHTRVIVLSMHANESYVLEALQQGASAYVLKDASSVTIVEAVREVLAGRRYLSPPLSQYALDMYQHKMRGAPLNPYDTLTTREREVLNLAARGISMTAMAAQLGVSPRTVETHRANLMRKLNLRTQTDLIRFALQHGIIALDE
jgi:two-component system, NarL family, response regulator NreC